MVRSAQRLTSRHYRRGPNGWGWSEPATTAELAKTDAAPDLDALTKADLVSYAEKAGVDVSGTKADILARLR
jgi:hypothetical protein